MFLREQIFVTTFRAQKTVWTIIFPINFQNRGISEKEKDSFEWVPDGNLLPTSFSKPQTPKNREITNLRNMQISSCRKQRFFALVIGPSGLILSQGMDFEASKCHFKLFSMDIIFLTTFLRFKKSFGQSYF